MVVDRKPGRIGVVHTYPPDKVPGSIQEGTAVITADLLATGYWKLAVWAGGKIGASHLGEQMEAQAYAYRPELEGLGLIESLGTAFETSKEQEGFRLFLGRHITLVDSNVVAVDVLHVKGHKFAVEGIPDWASDPRFNFDIQLLSHADAFELLTDEGKLRWKQLFTEEALQSRANYQRFPELGARIIGRKGVGNIGHLMGVWGVKERVEAAGRKIRLPGR